MVLFDMRTMFNWRNRKYIGGGGGEPPRRGGFVFLLKKKIFKSKKKKKKGGGGGGKGGFSVSPFLYDNDEDDEIFKR